MRTFRKASRTLRSVREFARGLAGTDHPLLVHLVPIRRCNIDCGYCNEYDKVSKPVPAEAMLARIDKLADLGTSVVAFSGGEPMLHPDLDALIRRIRSHGMIAGLITNGYLLSPKRIQALNDAGLDYLQISIDNVEPDEVSKKSLRLLDTKLQWLAEHAHFDININSVVGGGIKNPEDARTINRRARELGFSTSIGIIHDGSGILKPLGSAERAVFDDVMRLINGRTSGLQEPVFGDPQLPEQPGRRQAERLELPRRRAISVHLRKRPRALVLSAARRSRACRWPATRSRTSVASSSRRSGARRSARLAASTASPAWTSGGSRRSRSRPFRRAPSARRPDSGMANPVSFDITSGVDIQEVDNAVNQARKEVAQRYDFKGSRASIDLNREENTLTLIADDDFKMNALWEILQGRLVRRGVPTKNLTPGEIERAANDTVRRVVTLQQGIPTEAAKEIVKFLKDRKLKKVQAAIQADQVRVSSASKDDLQEAIRLLREHDFGVALQFGNYRG